MRDASLWTNSTALPLPHTWTSLAGTPTKLRHHYIISWNVYLPMSALVHAPPLLGSSIIWISSITATSSVQGHMTITWSSQPTRSQVCKQPHLHEWSTPMFGTISTVHERWGASWPSSPLANWISSPVCRSHGIPYNMDINNLMNTYQCIACYIYLLVASVEYLVG